MTIIDKNHNVLLSLELDGGMASSETLQAAIKLAVAHVVIGCIAVIPDGHIGGVATLTVIPAGLIDLILAIKPDGGGVILTQLKLVAELIDILAGHLAIIGTLVARHHSHCNTGNQ